MITCELCGKELKHIGSHLRYEHNMSGEEYRQLFPEAILMPPEYCVPTPGFTGHHHTDETKALMRKRIPWWIKVGRPNPAKSPEAREKIAEKAKLRVWKEERKLKTSKVMRMKHKQDREYHNKMVAPLLRFQYLYGENHPNWKGGISFEPYGLEFNSALKTRIMERDGYTCQNPECGATERLCVHHIDYDKRNNDPENLITLCNSCNSKANHNREDWELKYRGMVVD